MTGVAARLAPFKAIALLAATIGLLQWRTAHQRAVLDLFDKRMETYDALNDAVIQIVREGRATQTDLVAFDRAASKARFLFGSDVTDYLTKTRKTIIGLWAAETATRTEDDAKRAKAADMEAKHLMIIVEFHQELSFGFGAAIRKDAPKGPSVLD